MKKPDMPKEEQARLVMLRLLDVLDTLPEERFDRLTRMAKRLFGVPIALVSLVDESRQWFKSCIGLDASETPRDISFCGHAILGDDVFVISDTLKDQRFADNPLVLNAPSIRFYAGCPLVVNGYKLGTLCIIDQEPRNFDQDDIEVLKDLAAMVERELAAVYLATLDPLTSILNRRGFMVLAQHTLNLGIRQQSSSALVFLDLDKFKVINDQFGHAAGDDALMFLARQMKDTFRASDIIARLGGDEFVAWLPNTSRQQADEIIERLSQSLATGNRHANHEWRVSFSYGIVVFDPGKHEVVEDLLAEGDELMYEVKKAKLTQPITPALVVVNCR